MVMFFQLLSNFLISQGSQGIFVGLPGAAEHPKSPCHLKVPYFDQGSFELVRVKVIFERFGACLTG